MLNNEKELKLIKEELNILYNKRVLSARYIDGVLEKEFFNRVDNISQFVVSKVNIIKEYILNKNIDCLEIQSIELILGLIIRVQTSNIFSIKKEICKLKNDDVIIYDFNLLSPTAIPIYQEHINVYMKKLGFDN